MGSNVHTLTCALLVIGCLGAFAQAVGDTAPAEAKDPAAASAGPALPASYVRPLVVDPALLRQPWLKPGGPQTVNWNALVKESFLFASLQHSFRLATEPGTRTGLKGPFIHGWAEAVRSLHGWSDGDPFYVNYVGHPMQGSAAGFLWAQNDRRYLGVEFGPNPQYWRSRLRATAFSFAYSALFEIGPFSEASIGNVQSVWPQQGLVDHVITPAMGFAWMVAEDALDQYVIKRFEARVSNPVLRVLARGALNPARSWSNMMRFQVPWARDTRPGVFSPLLKPYLAAQRGVRPPPEQRGPLEGQFGVPSFELSPYVRPVYFIGNGTPPCLGGGAEAALRIVDRMQWVLDVSGCNLLGLQKNWSGDTLSYLTGPKWTPHPAGRWSPHAHLLLGGMKITKEQLFPELRESLNKAARDSGSTLAVPKPAYTSSTETNAFALAAGAGVDLRVHPAFALRVANLEYRRSFNPAMNGQLYNNGLSFTIAMVLRMGTW